MKAVILREILENEELFKHVEDGMIELKFDGGKISVSRFVELAEDFLQEQFDGFFLENVKRKEEV